MDGKALALKARLKYAKLDSGSFSLASHQTWSGFLVSLYCSPAMCSLPWFSNKTLKLWAILLACISLDSSVLGLMCTKKSSLWQPLSHTPFPICSSTSRSHSIGSTSAGVVSGRLRKDLQQPHESVSTGCWIEVPLQSWMNDRPQYLHQLSYLDSVCLSTKSSLLHYPRKRIWKFPMLR